jgi:hypothetical protein
MAQFTQLNLGGSAGKTSRNLNPTTSTSNNRKPTMALVGTLLATALAGVI